MALSDPQKQLQALIAQKVKASQQQQPAYITVTTSSSTYGGIGGSGGGLIGNSSNMPSFGNPLMGNLFSRGERVVLLSGRGRDGYPESNPVWGFQGEYIAGTIQGGTSDGQIIEVQWDNGRTNIYDLHKGNCKIDYLNNVPTPKKKAFGKKVELDTTKLEPLVIDPEVKIEIVALLQQHKHAKKIFDEWGLADVIEYGRGMTLMFWGPPGTGKTFGARCVAKALGKELLIIGAAEIQSSEPGGANRNIQQAFATAAEENKVLFIDECDSLIGNRAHLGMILSSEINTLLTEIEKSEGVVILATNRISDMDPALERRLSLIIEFPAPNFDQRVAIWKGLIPEKMPLHSDVDINELSEHDLTGGLIKNVVLQAARLAVSEDCLKVEKKHFKKAIERTVSSKNLMGKNRIQTSDGMSVGTGSGTDKVRKLQETFKKIHG